MKRALAEKTLKEYLDLLEGLSKGLCSSNKIEDFYNFAKLCLVKDEKNYDKFDNAFNNFYQENKKASYRRLIKFSSLQVPFNGLLVFASDGYL